MTLTDHLKAQGVTGEVALGLVERKRKSPALTGVSVGGRWVSLTPPSESTGEAFNRMIQSGQTPALVTDATFMRGTANGSQFEKRPEIGDYYRSVAEAEGQNVKGKKYLSQLARHPGDAEAWVDGRGDVQRILEKRGWGSEGSVKVKRRDLEDVPKPIDVAQDILDRELANVPGVSELNAKQKLDLKEKVKERLKPKERK